LQAVDRRDAAAARELLESVSGYARDGERLEADGNPLPEFPRIPAREILVGAYRLFFRREGADLWITGIWKKQTA